MKWAMAADEEMGENNSGPGIQWFTVTKKRRLDADTVVTTNRFAPLAQLAADSGSEPSTSTSNNPASINSTNSEQTENNEVRPPAFYIADNVDSVEQMINTFTRVAGPGSFTYRCVTDNVRINATTIISYNKLIKFCRENKLPFFTHQIRSQRAFKAVIKNLHHSYPVDSLIEELQTKGHTVRRINKMWNKRNNEPFNMFMVELEPAESNKDIFSIKSLDHCIVVVEAPHKRREVLQCHNCQNFHHSKNFCELRPRCVKCGDDHHTKDCKNVNSSPKCANCGQSHTANYRGCPQYQARARQMIRRDRPEPPRATSSQFVPKPFDFPGIPGSRAHVDSMGTSPATGSYAQVAAMDHFMLKIEKLFERQMEMTNNLLAMMANLMNTLCRK